MSKRRYNGGNSSNKEQAIVNNLKESDKNDNRPLTVNEVYDVLSFAQTCYDFAYGKQNKFDNFQGSYSPKLTNQRLAEIGLNPKKLNEKQLEKILCDPVSNQNNLIGYSEFLKFNDMIAKRTLGYLGNLPSFDYTFTCTNISDPTEYKSEEYKKDLAFVKDFLSKFDVRGQFSFVNRRTFEIDAFYSIFRMDGERYEFQELPYQYCRITGKNLSWGLQFDFDLNWFNKMGLSWKQYPKIFKKMYDAVNVGKKAKKYDPGNKLNKRDATYCLWSQTSSLPEMGNFACFKMNSDIYASMPYLTPMFQETINKPIIRELQTNQYIIASQKIMIGLIPLLKEQKSGQVKDALAVSPETMGKFLGLLKRGLSDAIKITGAPFADVKQVEFDPPQTSMYNQANEVQAASSGATSRLIYASDKQSATEIVYSANIDEMIAKSVYPQYEKWLSTMINHFTKKYKFKFKFEGTNFSENRKNRLDNALKLADKGIVMPAKIAASMGMDVFEMTELIQQCKYDGFQELLYLLPNSNTKDMGTQGAGRPGTSVPADSTIRSDDYMQD